MQIVLILKCEVLLALANGAPVIGKKLFGDRFAWPLDFGVVLPDGYRLLGASKTIRGLLLAVAAATVGGWGLGLGWGAGAVMGVGAMVGDMISSFTKRRLGRASSTRTTGLDQIPESLLPLLAGGFLLGLSAIDIAAGTVIFLVGEVLLSRLLYRVHIRDEPY
jgi:CDP-diglyceride synthetase